MCWFINFCAWSQMIIAVYWYVISACNPHCVCDGRRHSLYRETEEEVLSSSQELLEGYLSEIMDSVFNSAKKCPRTMRIVFRNLQEAVRAKWPEDTYEVVFVVCVYRGVGGILVTCRFHIFSVTELMYYMFSGQRKSELQEMHSKLSVCFDLKITTTLVSLIGCWSVDDSDIFHIYDQFYGYLFQRLFDSGREYEWNRS